MIKKTRYGKHIETVRPLTALWSRRGVLKGILGITSGMIFGGGLGISRAQMPGIQPGGHHEDHPLLSPLEHEQEDPLERNLEEGIALCLSGGGYRAMLFHAGVLWRLNEIGILRKLDRISSVSGG